jgi:3-carboxy-cis,cis-muconate cycloisomerase
MPDQPPSPPRTVAPSNLFGPLFGDPAVDAMLSDTARLQAMLDVEAALADAEAHLGIIPSAAAAAIRAAARAESIDAAALASEAANAGNLAIPLVTQLTRLVSAANAAADTDVARHVHWGATSQDIIDTGTVLQLRAAVPVILHHLEQAEAAAATLAREHIDTLMVGRTWLQHAVPITFGLKAAGWLDAIDRQRLALGAALDQASVLQFGGAAGTLAVLGERGGAVAQQMAAILHLGVPDLPWHAHRDRFATLAGALGVTCGVLGKIGRDLALLAQTEVGEAADGLAGGSSAMPQKQNPVRASVALAAAGRAPALVASILSAMPQEHERGLGGWQIEWTALPELVRVTAGSSLAIADALGTLRIDAARMRANLDAGGGLPLAEAVTVALAAHIARSEAHSLVSAAARRSRIDGIPLADALAADPAVACWMTHDEIERRLAPASYLGESRAFVERVLARVAGTAHGS